MQGSSSITDFLLEIFTRKFTLADDIVVKGADMKDGILSVSLERVIPEEDKPKEIKIS